MLDFFFEMRRADAAYTCVGLLRVRVRVLGLDPSVLTLPGASAGRPRRYAPRSRHTWPPNHNTPPLTPTPDPYP